jgi:HJR/Mrr/RecB family endonuclease
MDWIFQCNPKLFDLASALESSVRSNDWWAVNQNRQLVSPGDRVFFWQTGPSAGMLAIGRVTSPVYVRQPSSFGRYCVDIDFDYKIAPPLSRAEALGNETLKNFAVFKGQQGTNFVIKDPAIGAELDRLLEERRVPIPPDKTLPPIHAQHSLDIAIKQAKNETARKIREHIERMDPFAFQWLVRTLLLKLGYKNVEVMKQTGDGGVDVRATLIAGGIANIRTCVQVKRQPTVGRPVVQSLRGSLSVNEGGLLVTSGQINDNARKEAMAPGKVPIALVDGAKLVEFLLDHGIGVEHANVTLYRLRLDELSMDYLQAVVEAEDDEEADTNDLQPADSPSEE